MWGTSTTTGAQPLRRSVFHHRRTGGNNNKQVKFDDDQDDAAANGNEGGASPAVRHPADPPGVSPTNVSTDAANASRFGSAPTHSQQQQAPHQQYQRNARQQNAGRKHPYATSNPYSGKDKGLQIPSHPLLTFLCHNPHLPKVIFGLLWILTLKSWYEHGIPLPSLTRQGTTVVTGSTGVIAYSLYDNSGDGGGGGGYGGEYPMHDDIGVGGEEFSRGEEFGYNSNNYGGGGGSELSTRYLSGALANANLINQIYPGWTMRIYHDDSILNLVGDDAYKVDQLRDHPNVELVNVKTSPLRGLANMKNRMMWRFAVASDPSVQRYCIRDIDSRLSYREKAAVDEWIVSKRKFHNMRDHPSHAAHLMSGGMWCGTRDAVPNMLDMILDHQNKLEKDGMSYDQDGYMKDMDFLSNTVWPLAKRSILQHDAFSCKNYARGTAIGFPSLRQGGEHVGSVYVNGIMRQDDVNILLDAIKYGRQPRKCQDRNVVPAKQAEDGSLDTIDYTNNLRQQQRQDYNSDYGDFGDKDGQQQNQGWNSGPAARPIKQDPDKPIPMSNLHGRTCFKHAPTSSETESEPKPEREGQITSDTSFGRALRDLATKPDVRRILEIGTWYGGGSTHEFAEAIKPKSNCISNSTHHCCESFVVSFELFEPAWEKARQYHRDNPVWLVKGSTVGVDQMLKESELTESEKDEHFQLYYKRDKELMAQSKPKLEKFCNFLRPDVVLIDGNEYTGWGEFKLAMNRCRPRYIALHDTGTLKTKKAETFITKKKPELFEVVSSGQDAAAWSIYRFRQPDPMEVNGFRIIVLSQKRHWSLRRLLDSLNAADYQGIKVELEIRVDHDESDDHAKVVNIVKKFKFKHGKTHVHLYTRTEGLQMAWLNAWKPASDDERAVILEDDLELSPLWFAWLRRAWREYGNRPELGGISLCRQRLRASDGQEIMVERDEPFLYRVPGSFGFSPNARYWREFMGWVRTNDVRVAQLDVPGTVTTDWYRNAPDFWEQAWIWWCWTNGRALYTLYVHSRRGALIGHWAEPGVHAGESENPPVRNDELLTVSEPVLETFPVELVKFGWDFEVESGVASEVVVGRGADEEKAAADDDFSDNPAFKDDADLAGVAEGGGADAKSGQHVVWMNDFHISTVAYVKKLLEPKGVKFIDKSLSGHCHETDTCATDLKVLTQENGISPDEYTRKEFVRAYKDDAEMAKADIVMCFHPSAMCELFMPLKKRIFVIATTRYEMGRESVTEWEAWNKNLKTIAADSKNLVAANNLYDAKYIEYFTGIKPVLLPSWFKMAEDDMYTGISDDILVAPMHSSGGEKVVKKLKSISSRFVDLRSKYERYEFSQLSENTAIIHFPYQVSVMSLFEQYAMGIPILVPSPGFLWEMRQKLDLVNERTWQQIRSGARPSGSPISGKKDVPDPNDDLSRDAFIHWIQYSDFYQWPYIIQFTSWKDLRRKIDDTDWEVVSDEMLGYVKTAIEKTSDEWTSILGRHGSTGAEEQTSSPLASYLSEWTKTFW